MKLVVLIAFLAVSASAETYLLTNGVPVNGTVISSVVAQVVIKTPIGLTHSIPVTAFKKSEWKRLPQEACGIYSSYDAARTAAEDLLLINDELIKRFEKLSELQSKADLETSDVVAIVPTLQEERNRFFAEADAWREANDLQDSTPTTRRRFVLEKMQKYRETKTP